MSFRRVSPDEALQLMQKEDYLYVDVRSKQEFEAGHPTGAFNVPIADMLPFGMVPNPDFLAVMQGAFAKDSKLVLGCKAGGRSMRAASILTAAGYTSVVDQRAGYDGAPSSSGGFEPGWKPKGLPTSTEAAPDRTYEGIVGKLR